MFIPLNNHVEVEPVVQESIVASQDTNFEEKGRVLSVAQGIATVKIGDLVCFDSWLCAKYSDVKGNVRYLVPIDAIRAKECDEEPFALTSTY